MEKQQNNLREEELEKMDLLAIVDDIWRGLKRFWLLCIVVVATCAIVSAFAVIIAFTPTYEAYSTFVVNSKTAYSDNAAYTNYYNETSASQLSQTFPYILTSGALSDVVAKSLDMDSVPATITADSMEGTALFTIRVRAKDAQTAYDVLQAVIQNYPSVAEYIIGDTELKQMDESGVPEQPVNQLSFKRSAVKGACGGMILCLLFLLFDARTRKTVRREEDLKSVLSVPYLGGIPFIKVKKRSDKSKEQILVDKQNQAGMLGERIRVVRNRVMKAAEEQRSGTVFVTSAAEDEGKTTVAVNLAISLAQKGKRVVLVDGNLRKPAVAGAMGLETGAYGTIDALEGAPLAADSFQTYGSDGLRVLTGRPLEAEEWDAFQQKNIELMLDKLQPLFDYIIIDTPPCGELADALLFARCVHNAVLVARHDKTRVDQILAAAELLAETGTTLIGYTINGIEAGITGYGYGYGYGYYGRYGYGRKYGYGYGYGYGEKQEKHSSKNG